MTRILAGDIGGTKTLLRCTDDGAVVREERFEGADYATFDDLLAGFLTRVPGAVDAACFAVAGPVHDGQVEITNLGWQLEESALSRRFAIPRVSLINDFFGVAVGVPLLRDRDLVCLQRGRRERSAPIGILGAGTGLGEATLAPVAGGGYLILPSEGSHADFPPVSEEQCRLLLHLMQKYGGHVSLERLVSGMGLTNIHEFLGGAEETDPARIAELADAGDPRARRTVELFIDIYGAEAGNLALRVLARGGIYIAGGIAAKNVAWMTDGRFMQAFLAKGRFRELLETVPVDVIVNAAVGLMGAEEWGRRSLAAVR